MKTVFLKRMTIAIIAVLVMSMTAYAQEQGSMAVGGNLVFGSGNSYTNVGFGPKFQYNITDPIRLEGSYTYFLKKNNASMWDVSANAHYLFPINELITIYPLAGLSMIGAGSGSDHEFGLNLGAGIDYKLVGNLFLNGEIKYRIGDNWDRLLISAGIAFRF